MYLCIPAHTCFFFFLIFKLPNNTNLSCREGQPVCYRVAPRVPRTYTVSVLARVFFPLILILIPLLSGRIIITTVRRQAVGSGQTCIIIYRGKRRVLTHSHTSSFGWREREREKKETSFKRKAKKERIHYTHTHAFISDGGGD